MRKKIKERAKLLTETALKIWSYPEITQEELAPYLATDKPEGKYNIETYNTNEYTKLLFDALDKRIRNLSPYEIL